MTELMICEACGCLVTKLSWWCDCIKAAVDTQKLRPLTDEEWSFVQDEPPTKTE